MKRAQLKSNKAITLIALIITVIVMLILAGVAINLTIGENGIFKKSEEGAKIYQNAANNEAESLNDLDKKLENYIHKLEKEEIKEREGKEINVELTFTGNDNEMEGIIPPNVTVSIYKYGYIDTNGDIKVYRGFEELSILNGRNNIPDEYFEGTTQEKIQELEYSISNIGQRVKNIIQKNNISPILTKTTYEGQTEKINFKSTKLDNSIWFIVVENERFNYENYSLAADTRSMFMTKEGKITIISEYGVQAQSSVVGTTSPISVYLFCEKTVKNGTLEIVNTLNNYNPDMGIATFIFRIQATHEGQEVYSNLVKMNFVASGTKSILVEGIPINTQVNVKEIYTGGAYNCTNNIEKSYNQTDNNTVNYTNEYNNKDLQSAIAIMNFEYMEDLDDWKANLEEQEEGGYVPIVIDVEGDGWTRAISGNLNLDEENKFVRMSYFTVVDCDVTYEEQNWENKQGTYYYSTVLQGGEKTGDIIVKLNVPENYNKNFKLILIMEAKTAKTDELGNLYADWD